MEGWEEHLQMWVSLYRDNGAWECDGMASNVPISASGSHGEGCWGGEPLPHCQVTLGVALRHLCHGQGTFMSEVRAVSAAWTTGSHHVSFSCLAM